MKNMYNLPIRISILMMILLLNSCEENDYSDYLSLSDTFEINLVEENGKVNISWTLVRSENFDEYRIYRTSIPEYYHYGNRSNLIIQSLNNKHQLSHIDENPIYLGASYYWVEIFDKSGRRVQISNMESISIADFRTFNYFPVNVIFNEEENLLGFNFDKETGNSFTLYNFEKDEIIKEVSIYSPHVRPAFGKHNGNVELYFPTSLQRIMIYHAATMNEIQSLNLTGNREAQSITTSDNGKIYLIERYGNNLVVLNRSNGSSSRHWHSYLNGSDQMIYYQKLNKLLSFNNGSGWSSYVTSIDLNSDGSIKEQSSKYKWITGDYYLDFRIDPRNDVIYLLPNVIKLNAHTLEEIATDNPLSLNDIAFCKQYSYLALSDQKKIIKKDINDQIVKTFELKGYPVNVIKAKDKLIVFFVENKSQWPSYNYYLKGYPRNTPFGIEIIDL